MIIQTTGSPTSQAVQPDVRISGGTPARAPAPASERPAPAQPSAAELKVAVDALNKAMQQSNRALEFSVDGDTHTTVVRMVDTAEYKRKQAAPVLKVTARAFGTGRRMPIAQKYVPGAGA